MYFIRKMLGTNKTSNKYKDNPYLLQLEVYKEKYNGFMGYGAWLPLQYVIENSKYLYNSNPDKCEELSKVVLQNLHDVVLKNNGSFSWIEQTSAGVDGRDYFYDTDRTQKFIETLYNISHETYKNTSKDERGQYIRILFDKIIPQAVGNDVAKLLDGSWLFEDDKMNKNVTDDFFNVFCNELYAKYNNNLVLTDQQRTVLADKYSSELERAPTKQEIKEKAEIINNAIDENKVVLEDKYKDFLCAIKHEIPSDPVYLENGGVKTYYEKYALRAWIENNPNDPITRTKIDDRHPVKTPDLKEYLGMLNDIIDKYGITYTPDSSEKGTKGPSI